MVVSSGMDGVKIRLFNQKTPKGVSDYVLSISIFSSSKGLKDLSVGE